MCVAKSIEIITPGFSDVGQVLSYQMRHHHKKDNILIETNIWRLTSQQDIGCTCLEKCYSTSSISAMRVAGSKKINIQMAYTESGSKLVNVDAIGRSLAIRVHLQEGDPI